MDKNNTLGCSPFNHFAKEDPLVGESPFIMVYAGSCSLIEKVKNIEKAGGHLAIIINDKSENIGGGVFMNDDGAGHDISIPAVLISNEDGKILSDYYLEFVANNIDINEIRLEVKFENENIDNTVKYEIWYSPDQDNAYSFLNDLKYIQTTLSDNVIFGVHFFTYPHYFYSPDKKQNIENCYGNGLYCSRPGKFGVKDGKEIIKESLRQKCIYNFAFEKKDVDTKMLFWDYIENFYKNCVKKNKINNSCSEQVMKDLKIPDNYIQKCYEDSFIGEKKEKDYENFSKNAILDNEYELRRKNFVSKSPSITINDRVYLGYWRADNIFENLCSSLIKKPKACYLEQTFHKEINGVTLGSFLSIIFAILLINILLFLVCKNVIKKGIEYRVDSSNINNKIDKIVGSYLNLKDSAPSEE